MARADAVITVTGRPGVLRAEHLTLLMDGAMLGNMGHFSTELDIAGLRAVAVRHEMVNTHVEAFRMLRTGGASTSSPAARCSTSARRPATRSR